MDIEEIAAKHPDALVRLAVDIRKGLDAKALERALPRTAQAIDCNALVDLLLRLYSVYAGNDAELVEINPLVVTEDGRLVALDCKLAMDDSGIPRHAALAKTGTPDKLTELEARGQGPGPQVHRARRQRRRARQRRRPHHDHHGRRAPLRRQPGQLHGDRRRELHQGQAGAGAGARQPARQMPARQLLRRVRAHRRDDRGRDQCLAGARSPSIPIFFTIHGTDEDEAIAMVKERLGITPFDLMDDAVKAAVEAAR